MSQSSSWVRSLGYLLIAVVIVSSLSVSSQPASMQVHSTNAMAAASVTRDRANIPSKSSPSGVRVIASCLAHRCDGAKSIYGVSGSFDADSTNREIQRCLNNARLCHNPYTLKDPIICPPNKWGRTICQICDEVICPNGKLTLGAVQGLGASLVRFGVALACPPFTTGTYYWHLQGANPDANFPDVTTIVQRALFGDNLIPVIDFLYPKQCGHAPLPAAEAAVEMQDFVHSELGQTGRDVAVYFELGNEINDRASTYYIQSTGLPTKCPLNQPHNCEAVFRGSRFNAAYAEAFAKGAQALQAAMSSESHHKYWILTGSVLNPEASADRYACRLRPKDPISEASFDNYSIAQDALNAALKAGVDPRHLGIAVHPYHYNTPDTSRWHDYYGPIEVAYHGGQLITGYGADEVKRRLAAESGVQPFAVNNQYAGKCGDLGAMLTLWTQPIRYGRHQYQLPLVFTEDNWTTNGAGSAKTPSEVQFYLDGAYLVDFMSWMNSWARNHSDKPVRVLWYRGSDSGEGGYNLGLYSPGGGEKGIDHYHWCHNSGIKHLNDIRRNTVSADFRLLAGGGSC